MSWRIEGAYLESCNCDAICPCRMVDGARGGRSTHGICYGLLGWRIDEGNLRSIDLSGLGVALALQYDDDEPGSPWRFVLYVDDRGDGAQRSALEDIFTGRAGGSHVLKLPWVSKPSELLDVRTAKIQLSDDTQTLRVGDVGGIRVSRRADGGHAVACGIPGYDHVGAEYYADELSVHDTPYDFELSGNCAFATTFEYTSD